MQPHSTSLRRLLAATLLLPLALPAPAVTQDAGERPRAQDLGIEVGIFPTGEHNAITDVEGVRVGHHTVVEGDTVNTGVTAILPHGENPYRSRVPAAMYLGNAYGKLIGYSQVKELGELETPVLLTCTLCVWRAADAMVEWMLGREGMENVRSLNAVVGETNDGGLNDIRERPIRPEHVRSALETASTGPVEEGSVGAGRGTRAFGWKGGIGTSSRALPEGLGGYTVGVLVQTNFGGILSMNGAPVGRALGQYSFRGSVEGGEDPDADAGHPDDRDGAETERAADPSGPRPDDGQGDTGQGSVMIVVATDAPITSRNLERLAKRAIMGLARTGSFAGNGSGDYVIAFSTAEEVRRGPGGPDVQPIAVLENGEMSPLFQATVEATEEAIYNSLLRATAVTYRGRTVEPLPIDATVEVLERYRALGSPGGGRP